MPPGDSVTIRRAGAEDARALVRLAELDSARALSGEVLVAEVDGRLWAAAELATGRTVADPFRPSAGVVELLRLRAGRIAGTPCGPAGGRGRRYSTRWGYSASTSSR